VEISKGSLGRRLRKDMEKIILKVYKDQLMQIDIIQRMLKDSSIQTKRESRVEKI